MVISPKHGLNPSMDICFFCGEPKGIALFGKMKGDAEAPRHVLLNYEPCDKCKEQMSQGVTVIEVVAEDNGNRHIAESPNHEKAYPTGRWCVMRREAAIELFNIDDDTPKVLLARSIYERLTGGARPK